MRFMLDTNTLIYVLNARPRHQAVPEPFNQHDPADLCLAAITLAQLRGGAAQSQRSAATQAPLERIAAVLTVLPFDHRAARFHGDLRATLQAAATPIGPLDTLIAGHALSIGAILVTHNLREFGRVGALRCENRIDA